MQVVFSEEFSFPFFFIVGGTWGGSSGETGQGQPTTERTIFPKTYLFLVYFLLELKLYGYLTTISNQNAYYFTARLLSL